MKPTYKSPAELVIEAFGGVRPCSRALGRSAASVCRWRKTGPKGLKGRVPGSLQREILRCAQEQGLNISALDLIEGRLVQTKRK